jgi:uncharacterized protein
MNNDTYESLKEQVWEILKKTPHHRTTVMHLDGVAMLCAFIGLKRSLNVEICRCAGLLHDLWLFCNMPVDGETHKKHGYIGSELARKILLQNGSYSEDKMDIICKMVYNHNDKNNIHDEYSETLKDADSLQHYLNDSNYDKNYNYSGRDKKVLDEFMIKTLHQ